LIFTAQAALVSVLTSKAPGFLAFYDNLPPLLHQVRPAADGTCNVDLLVQYILATLDSISAAA
jgi:hypothetical protein